MTGAHEVRRVSIDPSVMDDREMLEDLIAAALNDAVRRGEALSKERWPASPPVSICRRVSSSRSELVNPRGLESLIEALRCLPGVGPKSAQRMAYHLLQRDRRAPSVWVRLLACLAGRCAIAALQHFSEAEVCERCLSPRRTGVCCVWSKRRST